MKKSYVTYRERPHLGTFTEGVFVEIIRGGELSNGVIGFVYWPPGGEWGGRGLMGKWAGCWQN